MAIEMSIGWKKPCLFKTEKYRGFYLLTRTDDYCTPKDSTMVEVCIDADGNCFFFERGKVFIIDLDEECRLFGPIPMLVDIT